MTDLARTIEALLFLSSEPLSVAELSAASGASDDVVKAALAELAEAFAPGQRGLLLREIAGGYTLASDPLAEDAAGELLGRPRHGALTPAQLETLAIVAYLEPVSRPEIARIRGVNAESPVASLLDRGLVSESGRSEFGAVLYRTTALFLKLFDLQSLEDLPDPAQWDPTPEQRSDLRERLLAAGEARAGASSP
jgi:segregation and condensation protein B